MDQPRLRHLIDVEAGMAGLRSYKLAVLAEKVGATAPSHRALDDVKTTLAVLLAATRAIRTLAG
ncbi:hypothetical protein [Ralstonia pseudosolanacearum]|uniref:hypothetical protein n=1 Tax=Ralstonia pseudosolanacearum TaxID=1310165 RepID=UPI0018D141ED|nr:hypothetical protein [Ralstonia pseudosolanacearum]